MDGTQVTFGRRGSPRAPQSDENPAKPIHDRRNPARAIQAPAPDTVLKRGLLLPILLVIAVSVVLILTAGSTRHGHELPYWMRTGADFKWSNFALPLILCVVLGLCILVPPILRPIGLQIYSDHLVYTPLIGFTRSTRWSDITNIEISGWGRYRALRVETSDGGRFRISAADLGFRLSDLMELLKTRRTTSCLASMILPTSAINHQFLHPGH